MRAKSRLFRADKRAAAAGIELMFLLRSPHAATNRLMRLSLVSPPTRVLHAASSHDPCTRFGPDRGRQYFVLYAVDVLGRPVGNAAFQEVGKFDISLLV